jgi:DNA-binding NtrC family response regulator
MAEAMPNQENPQARILVVDDDDTIRFLLMDTLSALGYKTSGAANGEEAINKVVQDGVDLVISDIRMPRLNGVDLLRQIKDKIPDLPVLIITAYNYTYTKDQALQSGADGFLAKPFRIGKIEEQIKNILKNKTSKIHLETGQPKKILVADDDEVLRNMLLETLEILGFQVTGVGDGQEALAKVQETNFDLAITDVRMPKLDGLSFLKKAREHQPKLPVVLITGFSQAYTAQTAKLEGADGYLVKPFRIEKIEELVRKLLGERAAVNA